VTQTLVKSSVLEITNSRASLALFNTAVSVALFIYGKLRTLLSMVTLFTTVTVVKQWVQLWDPMSQKNGFNCHTRMVWFPQLSYSTLHGPTFIGASLLIVPHWLM